MEKQEIQLYRTKIAIPNYTFGENTRLEYQFSIKGMNGNPLMKGMNYDLDNNTLYLPSGYIRKLENNYMDNCNIVDNRDIYDEIKTFDRKLKLKYPPKDEVQEKAIRFILGMKEFRAYKDDPQLSINLKTGKGKTYVAIASMVAMRMNSIIINNNNNLLAQWKEKLFEYTDIKEDEVLFIAEERASATKILKTLINKPRFAKSIKVLLVNHVTIANYGNTHGWEEIDKLFKSMGIGIKIFDECHKYFDNMCRIDYSTNTYKTLYLTATLMRSNPAENRIYQNYFAEIPKISLFDPETDRKTKYISLHYNSFPSGRDTAKFTNFYGLSKPKYIDYLVQKPEFIKIFHIIVNRFIKPIQGKILIFVGTNKGILAIKKMMDEWYPELSHDIGIYTSISNNKDMEKTKRIIFTTMKSAGDGIDFPYLTASIVLAEPFASKVLAVQSIGRTDRTNITSMKKTFYIELVDDGCKHIMRYYAKKLDIMNQVAKQCIDVHMQQEDIETEYQEIMKERQEFFKRIHEAKLTKLWGYAPKPVASNPLFIYYGPKK